MPKFVVFQPDDSVTMILSLRVKLRNRFHDVCRFPLTYYIVTF